MRVLIVDDHPLFRRGLRYLLSDLAHDLGFAEADNVDAALALAGQADLVLLDLHLRGSCAADALPGLCAAFDAPVVVISSDDDPRRVREAIDGGAAGFVPKASSPEVLTAALRLVLAGGIYLPPHALGASRPPPVLPASEGLSGRQLEVLLKAVQGKSNKTIARELKVSEGTVKAHLSAAFRILGVQNRTEAVYAAARLGIAGPPAGPVR